MKKYLLPLMFILLLAFTLVGDCWVSGYDQRIKVTTDHTKVDATLSNFPVTAFFTSTQAEEIFVEFDADEDFDRGQFALGDDTLLYADCELFDDSAQKGIYHFKVTSISSSAGTDIYFYYDNDHAHNTTYIGGSGGTAAQSVWDANFKAVYHMNDYQSLPDFWNTQYEATVEPDSDGWALVGNDYSSCAAGILTYDTSADDTFTSHYYKAPDIDFDAGFYLKVNLKTSVDMNAADFFEIRISDGTQNEYTALWFYDGKVVLVCSTGTPDHVYDTAGAFHTYEVYIKGTSLKVYFDGVEIWDVLVDGVVSDDRVAFGDWGNGRFAKAEMDYLYYALGVASNPLLTILDSTSNNNDGTKKGIGEPVEATGKVGQGQSFAGDDDYINCGTGPSIVGTGDFTVEAIIKTASSDRQMFYNQRDPGNADPSMSLEKRATDDIYGNIYDAAATQQDVDSVDATFADNNYHHAAFVRDSTTSARLYHNGAVDGTASEGNAAVLESVECDIGRWSGDALYWNGIIDEVRVSNSERVAAWQKATYNSLWDSLLTYGSEETSEEDNVIFFGTNF